MTGDNVPTTATDTGSSREAVATDYIGGAHYQRVKVTHGADGTATDVSVASPLPTAGTAAISGTVTIPPVSGTVAVSSAPSVSGTVAVSSAPSVSGTVAVSSIPSIAGTVSVATLPAPEDFMVEVAKGNISGHSLVALTGYNPDLDTGSIETIWNGGGIFTFPTAAGTLGVSSSNAADTLTGTGARTLRIEGLDASYLTATQTINLAGTAVVATTQVFSRVHRAIVASVGSGGSNAGTITANLAGTAMFRMPIGYNHTQLGFYTVPAGKTAYIMGVRMGAANTLASSVHGLLRIANFGTPLEVRQNYASNSQGAAVDVDYHVPITVTEKSDIRFDAEVGANNTVMTCVVELLLVNN